MRALVYESFAGPMTVREEPAPAVPRGGVVIRVGASGICRSDWHGWQGHDPDIVLPHVPGHELAGTIESVGPDVRGWQVGARVTVPFVCGCGRCAPVRGRRPAGVRAPDAARVHPLGLVRRAGRHRGRRRQPGRAAGRAGPSRSPPAWAAATAPPSVRWCTRAGCARGSGSRCTAAAGSACRRSRSPWRPGPGWWRSTSRPGRSRWPARSAHRRRWTPVGWTAPAAVVRRSPAGERTCRWTPSAAPAPASSSVRCLRARGRHVQVGLLPPALGRPAVPMDRAGRPASCSCWAATAWRHTPIPRCSA